MLTCKEPDQPDSPVPDPNSCQNGSTTIVYPLAEAMKCPAGLLREPAVSKNIDPLNSQAIALAQLATLPVAIAKQQRMAALASTVAAPACLASMSVPAA